MSAISSFTSDGMLPDPEEPFLPLVVEGAGGGPIGLTPGLCSLSGSDLGGSSSSESSSSIAESSNASDAERPICTEVLSSSLSALCNGRSSVIEPKRGRWRAVPNEGLREISVIGVIGVRGVIIGLAPPDPDARRGAVAPDARGLRGLGSFMDGLRDGAADRTAGVGGPS